MLQRLKGSILFIFTLLTIGVNAQNYINSPYTRYKVGDLINTGFATNRGLGGTSIALRESNQINYLNPASYTMQDTNSFLLQTGFAGRFSTLETATDKGKSNNTNLEYLAMGFPVTRWLNMSFGLVPYSRIQYKIIEIDDHQPGDTIIFDYSGFGGFNEFFIGFGLTIKELVSIGLNVNYLFGSLDRTESSSLGGTDPSGLSFGPRSAVITEESNYIANDWYARLGVQFHPVIKEKHKIIVGATLDAKSNINVKLKGKTTRYGNYTAQPNDSLYFNIDTAAPLFLPNKLGLGLSYIYEDRVLLTAEYITQNWTGTEIVQSSFTAGKYTSYRFGAEFLPVAKNKKTREPYYNRIQYRIGAYYTENYLIYEGDNIKDMGLTAGLGLPLKNSRNAFAGSQINIGYQYGRKGTTKEGLIKENYHIITIGFTLHDHWFLKPKYD